MVIAFILFSLALIVAVCAAMVYKNNYNVVSTENAHNKQMAEQFQSDSNTKSITITQLQEVIHEYEDKIITLTEDLPKKDSPYNRAMKLTNEIVPYITRNGDKIQITVFNNKGVTVEKSEEPQTPDNEETEE